MLSAPPEKATSTRSPGEMRRCLLIKERNASFTGREWGGEGDLNPRPPEPQSGALTTELPPPRGCYSTLPQCDNRCMFIQALALAASIAATPAPQHAHTERQLEMTVVSRYTFAVTIEEVKKASIAEKYGVQGVHELSKILTEKGFPRPNLTVVEICHPGHATAALNNDVLAGLMMPCPIMIWEEDGKVLVSTIDTRAMSRMYRGAGMSAVGEEVYRSLKKILSAVEKSN